MRIATVYCPHRATEFRVENMANLRWLRISEALARQGHQVDLIHDLERPPKLTIPGLRVRPYTGFEPGAYDAIKTLFHQGFEALEAAGGAEHPRIIAKLGSVVGSRDDEPGVHFFGAERARLRAIQGRIANRARVVVVLTGASAALWRREHGTDCDLRLVPTGIPERLPSRRSRPYPFEGPVALYAGHLYRKGTQVEVNREWQDRLNRLGRALAPAGVRLCLLGTGNRDRLDPAAVTDLGACDHLRAWDWMSHASVGISLAQGLVQHNESSKIYHYLRAGLPVVAEAPIPNAHLVRDLGLGQVVPWGDFDALVERVVEVARTDWSRQRGPVMRRMVEEHAWSLRAAAYADILGESQSLARAASPGAGETVGLQASMAPD